MGDPIGSLLSGGATDVVSGNAPGDALAKNPEGAIDAITSVATLGGSDVNKDVIGGDLGKLTDSTLETMSTGGGSNLYAGTRYQNWANILDHMAEPSQTAGDKWIRASGEILGSDGRNVMGNYVLPIVAGIVAGPAGAAGGSYFGNKIAGGDNESGAIKAGIAAGGSMAGGAASEFAGPLVNSAASNYGTAAGIGTQAAVNAGANAGISAAAAAAAGKDPLDAAMAGAISGGVTGLASPLVSNTGDWLNNNLGTGRVGNAVVGGLMGAGSRALSDAALGKEVSPMGTLISGTMGAYGGYKASPSYSNTPTETPKPEPQELSDKEMEDYILSGQYSKDALADTTSKMGLLNYDENTAKEQAYNKQIDALTDKYKGSFYKEGDLNLNPSISQDEGLTGKVGKGLMQALSKYALDKAAESSLAKLPAFSLLTSPNWGGMLASKAAASALNGEDQNSQFLNWQRTLAPESDNRIQTPINDQTSIVAPIVTNSTTKLSQDDTDTLKDALKLSKDETPKEKRNFKSKNIAGWQALA